MESLQKSLDTTKRKLAFLDFEMNQLETKRKELLAEQSRIIEEVERQGKIVDEGKIKRKCDYNPY